jgi:peptidoglycan/xylan/chitin deacetylase (PgdA/CDA1 family)
LRRILAVLLCVSVLALPVRADSGVRYAALTFDDGPSGRFTRQLLEGLQERGAKATFFLCGYRLKNDPKLGARIYEEGHEIGIHGYSHDSFCDMTVQQITDEIRSTAVLLPAGCHPIFLRAPGGLCGKEVGESAGRDGLAILSWSVDPQDWATRDTEKIVSYVTERTKDGDVILLHDMSESSVEAALQIVDILSRRGFQFVTATELVQLRGESLVPGRTYRRFRP